MVVQLLRIGVSLSLMLWCALSKMQGALCGGHAWQRIGVLYCALETITFVVVVLLFFKSNQHTKQKKNINHGILNGFPHALGLTEN
jgi:hypothetical protein